jgi:hypothetical protein
VVYYTAPFRLNEFHDERNWHFHNQYLRPLNIYIPHHYNKDRFWFYGEVIMLKGLRRRLNPAYFQSITRKPPFFEGWYFKFTDDKGKRSFAVIPGVYVAQNDQESHAFIQFYDGGEGITSNHRFPIEDFSASPTAFQVKIGKNLFTDKKLSIDLDSNDRKIAADVEFSKLTPWPVSLASIGFMGPLAWLNNLECYHGVLSMDHEVNGVVSFNEQEIFINQGRGYLEKDWGRAFPEAWVWLQCNHFAQRGIGLIGSIAVVPLGRRLLPGFGVGLQFDGCFYRFTTYNCARVIKLTYNGTRLEWVLRRGNLRLHINAIVKKGAQLNAPTPGGMDRIIHEALDSEVTVQLLREKSRKVQVLFTGTSKHAGMEIVGDITPLLKGY